MNIYSLLTSTPPMNDTSISSSAASDYSSDTTVVAGQPEASSSSSYSTAPRETEIQIHTNSIRRRVDDDPQQETMMTTAPPPPRLEHEERAKQPKPTYLCSLEEPDVIIVVGGIEFKEYRQSLRCWSGYFDVAFRSGMKETTTKRFEFPNRKPEEWEWIVALMAPMSTTKITMDTLPIALDWFDELCCTRGIQECDRVLYQEQLAKLNVVVPRKSNVVNGCNKNKTNEEQASITVPQLESVLEVLTMCLEFDLKESKTECLLILRHVLTQNPKIFTTHKEILGQIVFLVKEHEVCYNALWSTLELYLPSSIPTDQRKVLLENDLLHEFIYLEMSLYPFPRRTEAGRKMNNMNTTISGGASRGRLSQAGGPPQLLVSESPDVSINTTNAVCNNEYHGLQRRTWH